MLDNQPIRHKFNRAAATYDQHADLQHHIGEHLISLLPQQTLFARILDLGCGTGKTTELLAHQFYYNYFAAIDIAENFINTAKVSLTKHGINCFIADFDQAFWFTEPFNLIFSNMALQWSRQLNATLQRIISHLHPEGITAFSIPLAGTLQELVPFFAINTLTNLATIQKTLLRHNCELLTVHTERYTQHFPHTLAALRSLRHVGATHVINRNQQPLLGKSMIENANIQTLTYNIAYIIARNRACL